jgi:pimeloyl-ACP methyl ester carboxylesterase
MASNFNKVDSINCYMIPGLGATSDIFQRLQLPAQMQPCHIEWIPPAKGESLATYCKRLLPQINRKVPFVLLGVSFGGAVAMELAKHCLPVMVVLVSSIPVRKSLPFYLRWAAVVLPYKLAGLFPLVWAPAAKAAIRAAFGPVDADGRTVLYNEILKTDTGFLAWAMAALMKWDNDFSPDNTFHIHGSADRVLPLRYVKADVVIENGGHFIIFTHGREIGETIAKQI